MKRLSFFLMAAALLWGAYSALAGPMDGLLSDMGLSGKGAGDDSRIAAGLKEALSVGTKNAVNAVSRTDGYFANQAIKIVVPDKIQNVANVLSKLGYREQVDAFVLSMNRAAEKAAPQAASFFVDAIQNMTFEDARKIFEGGDTSATEFFKSKTQDKLYGAFKPIVSSSMDEVGVTKTYKEMVGKYTSAVPFASVESLDLDHYVTTKALDGLFYVLGQEEKKIRTDPAARVTDLLKDVFGK